MVRKHGDHGRVSETAAHVLQLLSSEADEHGTVSMSLNEIARSLGVGLTAASNSVRWLLDLRLLRVRQGYSYGRARVYTVVGLEPLSKESRSRADWYELAKKGEVYHRRVDIDSGRYARKLKTRKKFSTAA